MPIGHRGRLMVHDVVRSMAIEYYFSVVLYPISSNNQPGGEIQQLSFILFWFKSLWDGYGIDCCFLLLDQDYCCVPKQWSRLWGIGGSGGQFDFITIRGISAVLFRNTLLHNSRDSSHEERG